MAFSFMQDSKLAELEIESPHMDPAVVAVSAYPPHPDSLGYRSSPTPIAEPLNHSGIRELNLNHLNNVDEDEDWHPAISNGNNVDGIFQKLV